MSSYPIRHKHEENYKETNCDRDSSSGRYEMRTWDGRRKVLYEEGDTAALSTVVWDYGATTMEAEAEGLLSVHLISSEALNFRHQDPFVGSGTRALESNCPRLSLAWRRTEKWVIIKTEFRKRFTLIGYGGYQEYGQILAIHVASYEGRRVLFFAAPVRIVGPKMPGLLRREEHILSCDLMLV